MSSLHLLTGGNLKFEKKLSFMAHHGDSKDKEKRL